MSPATPAATALPSRSGRPGQQEAAGICPVIVDPVRPVSTDMGTTVIIETGTRALMWDRVAWTARPWRLPLRDQENSRAEGIQLQGSARVSGRQVLIPAERRFGLSEVRLGLPPPTEDVGGGKQALGFPWSDGVGGPCGGVTVRRATTSAACIPLAL